MVVWPLSDFYWLWLKKMFLRDQFIQSLSQQYLIQLFQAQSRYNRVFLSTVDFEFLDIQAAQSSKGKFFNQANRCYIWGRFFHVFYLAHVIEQPIPNILLIYFFIDFFVKHIFWGTFREGYRWHCWLLVLLLIKKK